MASAHETSGAEPPSVGNDCVPFMRTIFCIIGGGMQMLHWLYWLYWFLFTPGASRPASNTGENSPYGMIRGSGGNVGRTYPDAESGFATLPERAETREAIGLNQSRLHSTRPVEWTEAVQGKVGKTSPLWACNKRTSRRTISQRVLGNERLMKVKMGESPASVNEPAVAE